ncbi:ribosomal protein S5 domain 2-type protein [Polychytrium aggregatum]|uniref:ribosomal protein S5 domain 2-type protein n=1 Tax=Polychytrium aggregatum TaxID=110093 RepID=UPI0022FE7D49|nr:ribosomal protein S5 domain 2-type protein [Polychytrium aggregatum]KAI9202952.1 ribosomal protein S5 domain 2-type protein [Polychytrium aggregatum]
MVRELDPPLANKAFVNSALAEGVRADGRGPYDFRSIKITFGSTPGHAEAQLGKTRVLARVSCELVRPRPNNPSEGFVKFSTHFSPMASPGFEVGRMSDDEVLVSRMLEKALRKSRAVDTEGLCVIAGEKVWSIQVDIRVLDHEGNLLDCACIAAISALLHFRRPDVTVRGTEVIIHPMDERNPIPLSVHHIPVCVSFAFFDGGNLLAVDPSSLEEQVEESSMTMVVNIHRELCTLSKAGGVPLDMATILRCSQIAAVKGAEVTELIRAAVNAALSEKR